MSKFHLKKSKTMNKQINQIQIGKGLKVISRTDQVYFQFLREI